MVVSAQHKKRTELATLVPQLSITFLIFGFLALEIE